MSKVCEVCGKGVITGYSIERRGLAKKKGGVGQRITGRTKRRFLPNLQIIRVVLSNGSIKRKKVCTRCIKAGKVVKAV
jgi:large subunit ribosomal protein L28